VKEEEEERGKTDVSMLNSKEPSRSFPDDFFKRHKELLHKRTTKTISPAKVVSTTPEVLNIYFEKLEKCTRKTIIKVK